MMQRIQLLKLHQFVAFRVLVILRKCFLKQKAVRQEAIDDGKGKAIYHKGDQKA